MQDLKFFIGLVIGLEHKGRPCKMCNSVQQKLGHEKYQISFRRFRDTKGQIKPKADFPVINSPKYEQTNLVFLP